MKKKHIKLKIVYVKRRDVDPDAFERMQAAKKELAALIQGMIPTMIEKDRKANA